MIKQLRYLCTLLLIAVASVAWGQTFQSVLNFDCASASENGSKELYGVANTAVMDATGLASFLNEAASVTDVNVVEANTVYWAKGSGGTGIPDNCLKVGKASAAGNFSFTIPESYNAVDRVVIKGYGWKTTSTISVNNLTGLSPSAAATETTFTFDLNEATRTIAVNVTTSAVCITEIALYAKEAGSDTRTEVTLSFPESSYNATVGSAFSVPVLSVTPSEAASAVSFSSSNPGVASVDASTGEVTLLYAGETTITASIPLDNETYQPASAFYTLIVENATDANDGSLEKPFTVAEAFAFIGSLNGATSSNVYVSGIISSINEVSLSNGNATYFISDDGNTTGNQLEIYRGKYLENADFTASDQIKVQDKVVVCGPLVDYKGTYEFTTGNYLYSLEREGKASAELSFAETSVSVEFGEEFTAPTLNNPHSLDVIYSSSNTSVATVNANGEVTILAIGETTITASFVGDEEYDEGTASYNLIVKDPNAAGSKANPYTVAEARAAIDAGTGVTGVYAKGIVSKIVTAYNSQYGNISYNISADGTEEADQLQAFRGKSYNGDNFTSADDIQVGDEVVVYGNLKNYNDTYEFDAGNQLVSLTRPETPVTVNLPVFEPAAGEVEAGTEITISEGDAEFCVYTTDDTDPTYVDGEITNGTQTDATKKIAINEDVTIKAIAVDAEGNVSAVATAVYTIKAETPAQDVVIVNDDKTTFLFNTEGNEWGFPTTKTVEAKTYSANGYSIKVAGSEGNGYYFDEGAKNLLIGKKDAYLTLPAFGYDVEKIEVQGAEGGSGNVTQNFFVGDEAVSTSTTSAKVTHEYKIAQNFQSAGNIYTLKVTNANNTRVSKIIVYKSSGKVDVATINSLSPTEMETGASGSFETDITPVEGVDASAYTITYESSNENLLMIDGDEYLAGDEEGEVTVTVHVKAQDTNKYNDVDKSFKVTISKPIVYHSVSFSVNGEVTNTVSVAEGAAISLPIGLDDINNKVFVGWITSAIEGSTDETPEFVTSATMGTSDITYYAVFANATGDGASESATLTSSNIKDSYDTTDNSYQTRILTDGNGKKWNAFAMSYRHSNATSDNYYLQIKKSTADQAYYIQVPDYGTITKLEMTVSNTSKPMTDGGNTANIFFSVNNNTSEEGEGVVSGTGDAKVTLDCSELGLRTGFITAGAAVRIWDITVTYVGVAYNSYCTTVSGVIPGDVNGDGSVTIADVTALVNIILGKDDTKPYLYDHGAADVNGDEGITIADVTALVNIILGKTN